MVALQPLARLDPRRVPLDRQQRAEVLGGDLRVLGLREGIHLLHLRLPEHVGPSVEHHLGALAGHQAAGVRLQHRHLRVHPVVRRHLADPHAGEGPVTRLQHPLAPAPALDDEGAVVGRPHLERIQRLGRAPGLPLGLLPVDRQQGHPAPAELLLHRAGPLGLVEAGLQQPLVDLRLDHLVAGEEPGVLLAQLTRPGASPPGSGRRPGSARSARGAPAASPGRCGSGRPPCRPARRPARGWPPRCRSG